MSAYETLGESVVKRIKDKTSSFADVSYVISPMQSKVQDYPSVQVFWQRTDTLDHKYMQAQRVLTQRRVIMVSLIRVKYSAEEESKSEIHALLDEMKSIVVGFQPKIDEVYNIWPIYPLQEEFFEVSAGELGVVLVWGLEWQEQVEVDSEYYTV